ncbi:MAG: helix-turn-helix transcriptional regulator [Robiginitomaculum sp.]|nr:helix-turn-helix transcriptional regulator [Robiginitomaculum sp.]
MKIANTIRMQVLRGASDDIRELLLNKNQISLLREIGTKEVTSNWLAKVKGLSIQNANGKLERLRKAGYLTRDNLGDPTGGDMYIYECTPQVLNT